ncbi:uncharacterized protein [Euphorbia lathyris]|uniref:uncharacterized protein n=1 Tax=Euphorbia lathyris TaxID=212925 RepID=UPI003313BD87
MDSLLANYASSDEEQENPNRSSVPSTKPISSSFPLFSSIPQPKSKQQSSTSIIHHSKEDYNAPTPSSKLSSSTFSSLPQPKTQAPPKPVSNTGYPAPKRVVQFKPPINPSYAKSADFDDEEDEDEGEKARKQRRESESLLQTSNVHSLLSSMPAPRSSSTLGVLPSGSGRRAVIDTEAPSPHVGGSEKDQSKENHGTDGSGSASYEQVSDQNGENYVDYGGYSSYELGNNQDPSQNVATGDYDSTYGSYDNYSSNENNGDYAQYGSSWSNGLPSNVPESIGAIEIPFRRPGKRGRNDIPIEIIEVKQDELTKDRPREDQSKLTGIAFGPSYQAAASSKGKPTKLHMRKHQIGTLFHDMKQKEMELAERRAKGFLTKAQTHAKYGW